MPKEWKGVHYGGMERSVLFIDLDCRFDVVSISRALQRRIIDANGKFQHELFSLFYLFMVNWELILMKND